MNMPLEDIRILDLTRLLPGPYCSLILADFGAEVIKIEEPEVGDYIRWREPKIGEYSALFASLNRNKKSITLNLKDEKERQQFIELVKTADVLIESFRPGVMDRLDIGYQSLRQVNPGLIYCAISGFGQTGPYSNKPGHDINYISYAGLMGFQGEKRGRPTLPATQIADIGGGGQQALAGILLALMYKQKTGKGQFVDISMTDGVISWLQSFLADYLVGKNPQQGELISSGGKAGYGVYETADGRYMSIGALEPKFWKVFCESVNRSDFVPLLEAPLSEQIKMKSEIEKIIRKKTLQEWNKIFENKEACFAPVLTLEEVISHPQIKNREMIIDTEIEGYGKYRQIGIPIKLSETPGRIHSPAPRLGEHNEMFLKK